MHATKAAKFLSQIVMFVELPKYLHYQRNNTITITLCNHVSPHVWDAEFLAIGLLLLLVFVFFVPIRMFVRT